MSTKFYSGLHGCVRSIAIVALLCLPFLSVSAFAALSAPTGVGVSGLTPTAGTLQWEVTVAAQHDYDIIVSTVQLSSSVLGNAATPCTVTAETPGVVVFASAVSLGNTTDYALTGLTEGSHYYVYIRQNGTAQYEDHSAWVSYEFSTPCVATSVLPVAADFDGGNFLPSCWSAGTKSPTFSSATKRGTTGNSMALAATAQEGCFVYSPVFAADAHAYYLAAYVYGQAGATYRIGVAASSDLLSVEPVLEGTIAVGNTWQQIDATMPADIQAELEQGTDYVWVIYNAAADGAKTFYVDDVVIDELPTCVSPAALAASGVEANAVTLSWTERGTATAWVVEYASATDTLTANVTSNPFTLTGLAANTAYVIRVKAACSAADQSAWSTAIAVKTTCGVMPIPFVADFTGLRAGVPDCWDNSEYTCTESQNWNYYATGHGSGPCLRFNCFSASAGTTGTLYSPAFANGETTELMLSYYLKNGGEATLDVFVSTDGGQNFPLKIVDANAGTAAWAEYEVPFTAPANSTIVLKFVGTSDYGYNYMDLDDIKLKAAPTCYKPSGLRLAAYTTSSATLAWTAGGTETSWELTYKLGQNELQTVVVNNTPEYTISGLEANTSYQLTQLSLRAICSDTDTSDVATFSNITVKTPCDLVALPFTNSFDVAPFPGDCWMPSYRLAGAAGGWVRTSSSYDVYSGTGSAKLEDAADGSRNVLATPFFHSDAPNSLRVSFWMKRVSSSKQIEGVRLWVNTIATDTLGGTPFLHVTRAYNQGGTGIMAAPEEGEGWYFYTATIPAAGDVCILFEGISEYGNYSLIDDVTVEPVPTCDRPASILASALSATEASVEIVDKDSLHTAWEVVFGAVGFNPDEAAPIAVSSKNVTLTVPFTMVGQTTYEAYVRAVCSADDKSYWRGPSSFVYTDWSRLANGISFTSPGQYPWTLTTEAGESTATSGNIHVTSSVSDLVATVIVPENTKTIVSFDWATSSYDYYEGLVIYVDETNPTNTNYNSDFGKQAGEYSNDYYVDGSYEVVFTTPGTHTIRFRHMYTGTYATSYGQGISTLSGIARRDVSCVEPSVFNMGTITSTSAVLNWNNTGADSWEVALFATSQSTVALASALDHQTVTAPVVTFSDLTPNTQYFAYVRSNCGGSPSDWSEVVRFRTECAARAVPFVEGFEEAGSELCWKTVGNAVRLTSTAAAFDGARAAQVVNDSVAGMLVSPRFDVTSLADYEVSLAINLANVRYQGALKPLTIGVMTDPSDVSTYIDLGDIVIPSAGSWKEYRFSLADLATPDYADWADAQYIVVSMSDSATYYFDLVTVAAAASCPKPTALDVQPDGEDVVVTWISDAAAHYAEVALGDSVVFAGNVQTPFIPTGLAGNTVYKVRVRAICGEENSEWTPWLSFNTPCAYAELPYSEGFEAYTSATFPDCWLRKQLAAGTGYGTDYGDRGWEIYTSTYSVHTGSKSLQLHDTNAGTRTLAVLPMFDSPRQGGLTLSFWMYRTTGTTYPEEGVKVWVNSVPSLEGATALMHVTRCGGVTGELIVDPITVSGWYQYETQLPIAGPCYVMFEGISEYGSSSYIDDIRVINTPTCTKPAGLQLAEITTTSAQLTWTAGASETQWKLIYKLSGKTVADTVMVTDVPSYTITGLTVGSRYTLSDISLQAVCSDDDQSEAVEYADLTFTTECEVIALPFEEDFESLTEGIPACWDNAEGSTTYEYYRWNFYETGHTGVGLRFNSYSNSSGNTNTLLTPVINVGNATRVDVSFWYKNATGGNFKALLSHDGGETFSEQLSASLSASSWTKFEQQVTVAPNENIVIAFVSTSNYGNDDAYHYLDDVTVTNPDACGRPDAVNVSGITAESANVSVTGPNGSVWQYVLNDVEAAPATTNAPTFSLTGLEPNTEYVLYVRRSCGGNDVSAWRSVTFRTLATCVVPAGLLFREATSASVKLEISDPEGTAWEYKVDSVGEPVAVTDTIFTIGGLTPDTDYTIYLRRVCSDTDKSEWIAKSVFTTKTPVEFFEEDFDSENSLEGWHVLGRTSTNYPTFNNTYGVDGSACMYIDAYDSEASIYSGIFCLPEVTGNIANYRCVFDAKKSTASAAGNIILGVAESMGGEITYVDTVVIRSSNFESYVMNFANYTGTGKFPILFVSNLRTTHYIDNVVVEPIPSCERPQAVAAGGVTASSVIVTITDSVAAHDTWEVVIVDHNADPSTGTPVVVNTKTSVLNGSFIAGVVYDVYVRTACSETDKSNFAGPATFKFVDYSSVTDVPVSGVGAYPWAIVGDRLQSTNQGVHSSTSDLEATFVVPAGARGSLSFQYRCSGESSYDYLVIYIDQPSPSESNYDTSFGRKGSSTGVTGNYTINLTEGTHTVRWRYRKDSSGNAGDDCAEIWNLQYACTSFFVPANLGATAVTNSSATLFWTGSSDAVRHEVRLLSNDIDTVIATVADSLQVSELLSNTAYQFRVRSFSAGNDSTAWSAAYRFKTLCDALDLPYVENFESYTSAPSSAYTTSTPVLPDCWTVLGSGSMVSVMNSTTYASSGSQALFFAGNADLVVALPAFAAENLPVRFNAAYRTEDGSTTSNGTFQFGYLTVPGDASSFVAVQDGPLTTSYRSVSVMIPAAEMVVPAIKYVAGDASNWYAVVDNITVDVVPACDKPQTVAVLNISPAQVDVAILDSDPDHTAWQAAFGARGFNPDAADAQVVDVDSKTFSFAPAVDVVDGQYYDLYVRTVCGDSEFSPWSIVVTTKYADLSAVSDVNLDLSYGEYPWEMVTDGGISKMQSTNQGIDGTTSDLVATVVVAEGEMGSLSFDFHASGEGTVDYPYDFLVLYIDGDVDYNFGDDGIAGAEDGITDGNYIINLAEGTHTIRWSYTKDGSAAGDEDLAQVWNIHFLSTATWAPVDFAVNDLSSNSAVVTWAACPGSVSAEVMFQNQIIPTAVNGITLENLAENTEYTIQVRTILASDTTLWSAPFTFHTDCAAKSLPYATGFEEEDGGLLCWTIHQTQTGNPDAYGYEYGDESWQITTRTDTTYSSSTVHTGFAAAELRDMKRGVHSILVSPELIIPEGNLATVSFWMYRTASSYYEEEGVKVWAGNSADLTGATPLMYVTRCGQVPATGIMVAPITASGWYRYEAVLPAGSNHVIFEGISEYGASSYIDDVRISRVAKADTIFDGTCAGGDYEGYGFSIPANQLTPGYHTFQYTKPAVSDLEADSIFTLKLFVSQSSYQEFRDTICAHSHYTGYGFDIADVDPLRTTAYVRHLTNQFGCDSTVALTLFVPQTEFAQTVHLCEGDSYVFGDSTITTSGVYVRTYENQYGCDSTITLQIFFHGISSTVEASICPGDVYTFDGRQLTEADTYTATFKNAAGCDSVVTLTLTVTQPVVSHYDGVFCEGTTFAGGSISPKFMDLTAAGTYTDTLVSVLTGCDSILVLDLVEEKIQRTTVNGTYSDGKPFVYDGQSYQEAGTFEIIKSTVNGCDSIITLIIVKDNTALDNLQLGELSVSPNPVQVGEEAVINTEIIFSADYVLRVYDAVGRLVTETRDANGRVPAMPVAGVYTVRITADNHSYQSKLIVK